MLLGTIGRSPDGARMRCWRQQLVQIDDVREIFVDLQPVCALMRLVAEMVDHRLGVQPDVAPAMVGPTHAEALIFAVHQATVR